MVIHQDFLFLRNAKSLLNIDTLIVFFFVLSSFLITKILLTAKQKSYDLGYGKTKTAFAFLVRRALRIFPAYYFYLFLVMLWPNLGHYLRQHAGMYFSYLSNFRIYADQAWEPATAHLWTLGVEEQFYIVWPWIILFVPNKALPRVFYFMIAAGIAFRISYFAVHPASWTEPVSPTILTPSNLDAYGCGGMLAYWHVIGKTKNKILSKLCWIFLPFWTLLKILQDHTISPGIDKGFASLLSMVLIEGASNGYKNLFGKFLESKLVTYLGKISYGLYLYHLIAPIVFWWVFFGIAHRAPKSMTVTFKRIQDVAAIPIVNFIIYFSITVLFATASWYLLEQPVNNLKRYIRYSSPDKSEKKKSSLSLPNRL
jgi:peptidoglycan/LPS O-acetylase OafA/YrhL